MKYDFILFDVDDTLFDFGKSETAALDKVFDAFGLPAGVEDYKKDYEEISKGLWRKLEQGGMTISELGVERFRRLFLSHELEIDADVFNQRYLSYLSKETHLVEGAVELCKELADCQLAIITNGFTDVQTSRIERSPLFNYFEQVIISEAVGFQKPAKEIFEEAFSKLGITDKTKVLMVGDSLTSDIQGGNNYNIDTCWFNPGATENYTKIQPTYEIGELTELVQIIKHQKSEAGIK